LENVDSGSVLSSLEKALFLPISYIYVEKYKQMVTENEQMHYHLIELEEKKQKTREICSP